MLLNLLKHPPQHRHNVELFDPGAGSSGAFRSHMANILGVDNDLHAVNAWLGRYQG